MNWILVVDDDQQHRQMLKDVLEDADYEVDTASDGKKGLDKWHKSFSTKSTYDLLIIDLKMPKMDGKTLIKNIRQSDKNIPIIVITGFGVLSDAYKLLKKFQISNFLNKPLRVHQDLLFAVKNAMEKQQIVNELKAAKCELETKNKQMNRFVGMVSHDLRGPLITLKTLSSVVLTNPQDKVQKKAFEIIQTTANQAFELVHDLLDIAAIKEGSITISLQKWEFSLLCQQAIQNVQIFADKKEINLITNFSSRDAIHVDGNRIRQVLENLITNAIKFTPRTGNITIQTCTEKNGLHISIIDSGKGIPPGNIPKLFDSTKKISTPGTEKEPGTGYGLLLCQEILRSHQSKLNIQSKINRGSCFSFSLPWWIDKA